MTAIFRRNLKIYFTNITTILFSILGALIVFGLYLLFLRKNMLDQFTTLPNGASIMDYWMLGGLLATTGLTTSFMILGQLIKDKSENKFLDFSITEQTPFNLLIGYFLSAWFISAIMEIIVLIVCVIYFYLQGNISITIESWLKIFSLIIISTFHSTAVNLVICSFIKSENTLRTFNSILGALSGFICTAYLPIGSFSGVSESLVKLLPISYVSSSFRRVLLTPLITELGSEQTSYLKGYLGIGYSFNQELTSDIIDFSVLVLTAFFSLFMLSLMSKKILRITLN